MRSLTSVEPRFLGFLAPETAVDLFRRLLWAEARRAGIGLALVSVPGAINVADGGVDAEIAEVPPNSSGGLLFPGLTRYQIKTGAFSAANDSEMKELFLREKSKDLKDRVRTCFQKHGTFVVVLFGSDIPDRTDDELNIACQEFIARVEPDFKDRRIRILRQNQIAGFLDQHVALALQAQMKSFPHLRTHDDWGGEIESLGALKVGARQDAFLKQVRIVLRQPMPTHLCVWGEPGIGKTRLLYEATGVDDLSPSTAYFRSPQALEQSGVVDELVRNVSETAVVVVDDCSQLEYEISVLSPLRHVMDIQQIHVGRDGLLIKKGDAEGLLLPQVAAEQHWDRITFLEQTCRKAGLPPHAWQDQDADIFRFSALVFGGHRPLQAVIPELKWPPKPPSWPQPPGQDSQRPSAAPF